MAKNRYFVIEEKTGIIRAAQPTLHGDLRYMDAKTPRFIYCSPEYKTIDEIMPIIRALQESTKG